MYVKEVAKALVSSGARVFYDEHQRVELWGKDLYAHLDEVYRETAYYCVMFVSRYYAKKLWTNHERKSAQARAFSENDEYILPVRFDNTKIPGLLSTVGYVDLHGTRPAELAAMIQKKLGPIERSFYVPYDPDVLFKRMGCRSAKGKDAVRRHAYAFISEMKRMTKEERILFLTVFMHGCPAELPKNVHADVDLVRRETGFPVSKIRRLASGLGALGFTCTIRGKPKKRCHNGKLTHAGPVLAIEFFNRSAEDGGPATDVVDKMILAASEQYCACCAFIPLLKGDFSTLSSAFVKAEKERQET